MLLNKLLWSVSACVLCMYIVSSSDIVRICELILAILGFHIHQLYTIKYGSKEESNTASEPLLTKALSNLVACAQTRLPSVAKVHSAPTTDAPQENTSNNKGSTEELVFRPMRMISQGQKWRSIINKITPEKFNKLSDQLLDVLPRKLTHAEDVSQAQEVIASVFAAATRQHHYAEMYASLCTQLRTHFAETAPKVDFKSLVWAKCEELIQSSVISPPPRAPEGLSADDKLEVNMKSKEIMVGSVKFAGELVSRQQIPVDGVMKWILNLISDFDAATTDTSSHTSRTNPTRPPALGKEDNAERERRLECACAMLTTIGPSLSDNVSAWGEKNLDEIDRAFDELSRLVDDSNLANGNAYGMGDGNDKATKKSDVSRNDNIHKLCPRIHFLINDLLDLRNACWKEVRAHRTLKPTRLESRVSDKETPSNDGQSHRQARKSYTDEPEEYEDGRSMYSNNVNEKLGVEVFVDFKMMNELPTFTHTVELVDFDAQKIDHLRHLMTSYHHSTTPICDTKVVILAQTKSFPSISQLFHDVLCMPLETRSYQEIDSQTPSNVRDHVLRSFNDRSMTDWPNVLVINLDVAGWDEIAVQIPAVHLLITFDVDSWFNNLLRQLVKWVRPDCVAVTFFHLKVDWGRACQLATLLQWKRHRVPPALSDLVRKLPKKSMNAKWKPYLEKCGYKKNSFGKMESRSVPHEMVRGGKVPLAPQWVEGDAQLSAWYQCCQLQWPGGDMNAVAATPLYASRSDTVDANFVDYCHGNMIHAPNDHSGIQQFNIHDSRQIMLQNQNACDRSLGLDTRQSDAKEEFHTGQYNAARPRRRKAFERRPSTRLRDKDFNAGEHEEARHGSQNHNA
eukprot:GEMP01002436.1.p1 GENE.GEMP01002436.1~~GEMP01002436.1.p1  ORF type:complete len:850 (+),score=160.00 GEMP01002436.1:207-2756(+)